MDQLKAQLIAEIRKLDEMIVNGTVRDWDNYRRMTTERATLLAVIKYIDKIDGEDAFDNDA